MRQGRTRTATEVEQLIREKQQQMERSSLTIKEEKAALNEMKKMKNDAARAIEWESEFDELNNKRTAVKKEIGERYEALDAHRNVAFRAEAAAQLDVAVADLTDARLTLGDELLELLSSPLWRKRLAAECSVVSRMDRGAKKGIQLVGTAAAVEAAALIQSIGPSRCAASRWTTSSRGCCRQEERDDCAAAGGDGLLDGDPER